ncbi:GntR family transcriptional regulator [Actinomadura fulvescens]|uniref:GntR family transcriptional regulator n=1 Tax=Actinomadura fulvescens TaxID=46160 RepID=A0ABN3PUU4_9ACTN
MTPAAADRAYEHVRERLLSGDYLGGELLTEGEIATALDLSRTPVREAFLRLQAEGFLRLYPKRGALVVPVRPGEARHVMEARLLLERHALDTVAAEGPEALRRLGEALASEPAAGDTIPPDLHTADRAFHVHLVKAAGNPVLADMYESLRDRQLRIAAVATGTKERAEHVTAQHRAIAAALAKADAATARSLLHTHINQTLRALTDRTDLTP